MAWPTCANPCVPLQFNILRTLVKNNADDDTIATYLGTLSSLQATSYRDEKHQEIRCYREEKLKEIGCYREEILRLQVGARALGRGLWRP